MDFLRRLRGKVGPLWYRDVRSARRLWERAVHPPLMSDLPPSPGDDKATNSPLAAPPAGPRLTGAPLASRVPPAAPEALEAVAQPLARLRGELAGAEAPLRKARLLVEIGELEEQAGDEPAAAREYLAAYQAEPAFREALEALARLLERRRSLKNLARVTDSLVRVADSPEDKVRALLLRATVLESVEAAPALAMASAREAAELDVPATERASAWLLLELLAGRSHDGTVREEALTARAALSQDPTWRGLLLIDVARAREGRGDAEGALEALDEARGLGGGATFAAACAAERVARSASLPKAEAAALLHQARLIETALDGVLGVSPPPAPGFLESDDVGEVLDDEDVALVEVDDDLGSDEIATGPAKGRLAEDATVERAPPSPELAAVPPWRLSFADAADARLRAAVSLQQAGDTDGATAALEGALLRARKDTTEEGTGLLRFLQRARLAVAEASGDSAQAASLARGLLEGEDDGPTRAALALRVGVHAATEGDAGTAREALERALAGDPSCLPARAQQLDLLAATDDRAFAEALEAFARTLPEGTRGGLWLTAAYVWGAYVRDGDPSRMDEALAAAGAAGVNPALVARVGRTLTSLTGDAVGYGRWTKRLRDAVGATDEEVASLAFEGARDGLRRGDTHSFMADLEALQPSWLGLVLLAFLPGVEPSRRTAALEELARSPSAGGLGRGLLLAAALRVAAAGDAGGARLRLRDLAAQNPADAVVGTVLMELERGAGPEGAARASAIAQAAAAATADGSYAAALHLEAGLHKWRSGQRREAVEAFAEAALTAPEAGQLVLAWALAGVDVDDAAARSRAARRALDPGPLAAPPPGWAEALHLQGFGLALTRGAESEALSALAAVDTTEHGTLALAAALGRLAWSGGSSDGDAMTAALVRIAAAGAHGGALAAVEQLRLAREGGDPADVATAARVWFEMDGGVPASLEWLGAALAMGDGAEELTARTTLAHTQDGEARAALLASTVLLGTTLAPGERPPLLDGDAPATRLANLELSPPGCDPRRRAEALENVGDVVGEGGGAAAKGLAGWSLLVLGQGDDALRCFDEATAVDPDDLAAWEGLRTAAELLGDTATRARAACELGARCADDRRAAAFCEEGGLLYESRGDDVPAEAAFEEAFRRDPTRAQSFDKLFRSVRDRKEGERLLRLIARRLEVTDDPREIAKLFWEQARVLREKGEADGALKALENVTMLEPDHVGALALSGEIFIRKGLLPEAAEHLARLAGLESAPAKNRVTAGIAAVDLYENKLDRHDDALAVLLTLHRAGLSTLPVRERLARAAARTGAWKEATAILEELMVERTDSEGRAEAARLAMVIHRDRRAHPRGARAAARKLLDEVPWDGEAIDLLVAVEDDPQYRTPCLEKARDALRKVLSERPADPTGARRLAMVAKALGEEDLQHAALAVAVAVGGRDSATEQPLAQLVARKPRAPQIALTEAHFRAMLAAGDDGPLAELFLLLGPTLAEALGPSLAACGVSKRDRVDPRSGLALRNEIAAWTGAFGLKEFDLYVGGKDATAVQGVASEVPAIVVGSGVNAPLSPTLRARVARELWALARGTTILRHRDETTIAAIVVAASSIAEVPVPAPPYAMLAEVEKLMAKAMPRRTRKLLGDVCRDIAKTKADARAWSRRALLTQGRVAAVASGDANTAIADLLGEGQALTAGRGDPRADEVLRFLLSDDYLTLRRGLGLEGAP